MNFDPRPCQAPMLDIATRLNRCNVFASPGTGKTSAMLAALDALALAGDDVFPVLVAAPLRVANLVWHDEIAKWAEFQGIRPSRILGSADQRQAGLRARADLYTINPANLLWLTEELAGRWPFRTVICDESTFIKNHRVSLFKTKKGELKQRVAGKAKNARALVSKATYTRRWINLTGTPTPKGVVDLWGQCWPIDFGKALGRTFTNFKHRWFRPAWGSSKEQERLESLPGAEDQILEFIKPFSASIDAYDYFDIDKPVLLDVTVELPDKARAMYRQMHKEAVVEVEETHSLGVNEGSKLMKCRQIASGHLRDEQGTWHSIHDAKIEALQELDDRVDGPLLVAYYFKEDVKAIQQAFPKAEVMPSDKRQKAVTDRWNEGKIPMLLIHPQSAGHGLNLQWGGNHLCIYTPDWNAEYYEQVIERLGPTRQKQAGFDRLVYVHRLKVKNTWDEIILANIKKKMNISELVKNALQMPI